MRRNMQRPLFALLAVAIALDAGAATYVVAPNGSDNSPGTGAAPWRTLKHAARSVRAGDRVEVRAGSYAGFGLRTSGTEGAPIEFIADDNVVITGGNGRARDGINLEGASHVVIDGFEVIGAKRAGVRAVGPSSGGQRFSQRVTLRNLRTRNNRVWGVFTGFVNDLLIENVEASGSVEQHGIYVSNSGDRPVVRRCRAWGNHASGIQLNADASAGLDGVIEGALVEQNVIYDNGRRGGAAINLDGVRDSRIVNNLLYNNHASGVALFQIDGGAPSTGNTIAHNTIVQPSDGRWAIVLENGAIDTTIANNILLNAHVFRGAISVSADSLTGLASDHNALKPRFSTNSGNSAIPLGAWQFSAARDRNSVAADAERLFVNPADGDYRLRKDAPARDLATAEHAVAVDLNGDPRPIGAAADAGAFEWSDDADR